MEFQCLCLSALETYFEQPRRLGPTASHYQNLRSGTPGLQSGRHYHLTRGLMKLHHLTFLCCVPSSFDENGKKKRTRTKRVTQAEAAVDNVGKAARRDDDNGRDDFAVQAESSCKQAARTRCNESAGAPPRR